MMKRIIKLIVLFLTVFMLFVCSSCVTMCVLQRRIDKEVISDDSNYLQYTGVIVEVVYFNNYSYGEYESLFSIEGDFALWDEEDEKMIWRFEIITKDAPNLPERGYIAKIGDEVAFKAVGLGGIDEMTITEFYANGVCYITHEEGKAMKLASIGFSF